MPRNHPEVFLCPARRHLWWYGIASPELGPREGFVGRRRCPDCRANPPVGPVDDFELRAPTRGLTPWVDPAWVLAEQRAKREANAAGWRECEARWKR